ncbi:MAG: hypothetical protein Q4E64_08110 [Phascolarctobacterium sp.]|uniref:hypothetical protein n=1 Tax=Phascolarctobacterium sp. TaxID=2049039 RepID=UPI0026DD6784|nr:hypothetical protein [Phascolarctobacterium sp.]MDO4921773.1 hypothetical protein [Phascolarctobacterium sp.]
MMIKKNTKCYIWDQEECDFFVGKIYDIWSESNNPTEFIIEIQNEENIVYKRIPYSCVYTTDNSFSKNNSIKVGMDVFYSRDMGEETRAELVLTKLVGIGLEKGLFLLYDPINKIYLIADANEFHITTEEASFDLEWND